MYGITSTLIGNRTKITIYIIVVCMLGLIGFNFSPAPAPVAAQAAEPAAEEPPFEKIIGAFETSNRTSFVVELKEGDLAPHISSNGSVEVSWFDQPHSIRISAWNFGESLELYWNGRDVSAQFTQALHNADTEKISFSPRFWTYTDEVPDGILNVHVNLHPSTHLTTTFRLEATDRLGFTIAQGEFTDVLGRADMPVEIPAEGGIEITAFYNGEEVGGVTWFPSTEAPETSFTISELPEGRAVVFAEAGTDDPLELTIFDSLAGEVARTNLNGQGSVTITRELNLPPRAHTAVIEKSDGSRVCDVTWVPGINDDAQQPEGPSFSPSFSFSEVVSNSVGVNVYTNPSAPVGDVTIEVADSTKTIKSTTATDGVGFLNFQLEKDEIYVVRLVYKEQMQAEVTIPVQAIELPNGEIQLVFLPLIQH